MSQAVDDGGITATAFNAVSQVVRILTEAVNDGREIDFEYVAGQRDLEPRVGTDGKKYQRVELDGSYEIRIAVRPFTATTSPPG